MHGQREGGGRGRSGAVGGQSLRGEVIERTDVPGRARNDRGQRTGGRRKPRGRRRSAGPDGRGRGREHRPLAGPGGDRQPEEPDHARSGVQQAQRFHQMPAVSSDALKQAAPGREPRVRRGAAPAPASAGGDAVQQTVEQRREQHDGEQRGSAGARQPSHRGGEGAREGAGRHAQQTEKEQRDQDRYVQQPLDQHGARHQRHRRPKLAAEPHDPHPVTGPVRQQVVHRHADDERPDAGAERQRRLRHPQQPPPAYDPQRPARGQEAQDQQHRGEGQAGDRPAQSVPIQIAGKQPPKSGARRQAERRLPPAPRPQRRRPGPAARSRGADGVRNPGHGRAAQDRASTPSK